MQTIESTSGVLKMQIKLTKDDDAFTIGASGMQLRLEPLELSARHAGIEGTVAREFETCVEDRIVKIAQMRIRVE